MEERGGRRGLPDNGWEAVKREWAHGRNNRLMGRAESGLSSNLISAAFTADLLVTAAPLCSTLK